MLPKGFTVAMLLLSLSIIIAVIVFVYNVDTPCDQCDDQALCRLDGILTTGEVCKGGK